MLPWPNRSIEEYLNHLKSPDSHLRCQAAAALDILQASSAVEPLIETLKDTDKDVRLRAAQALGNLGNSMAVTPLINMLQDPEWEIRSQAVRSLEKLGDLRAITPMCKLLQDREGDINYHVTMALSHMPNPISLEPLLELLMEGDESRSFHASIALGSLGALAVPPLIKALHHPNRVVRRFAAMALLYPDDKRAALALVKALQEDPDYDVTYQAKQSLVSIRQREFRKKSQEGKAKDLESFLPSQESPDEAEFWRMTDELLEQYNLKESVNESFEELISSLHHPDWSVRRRAVIRLGEKQDRRALDPLVKALSDPSEEVRGQVVIALAKLEDERVVEPLIKVLEDPGLNPSTYVYGCLERLGKIAISGLIAALKNESIRIRCRAASLLGDIGDPSALPALSELEHDEGVDNILGAVRDVAASAIRRLNRLNPEFASNNKRIQTDLLETKNDQEEEKFGWRKLLKDWSKTLLGSNRLHQEPPEQAIEAEWLGNAGATEEQIVSAENRLGVKLPPSYRAFLKVTNGWGQLNSSIEKLWPIEEVEWFAVRNQDWIDAWNDDPIPVSDEEYFVYGEAQSELTLRSEYLQTALEISAEGDLTIMLLNPQVITPEGEWEAWFFGSWFPGAYRYRSFWEMMQEEYTSFLKHLE